MRPSSESELESHWKLRRGDIPGGRLGELAELRGLEENAVYRLLLFQAHRQSRSRTLLVVAYIAFWLLLGAPYFNALGAGAALSILYALILAMTMAIAIAALFWLLGIQGYETNGRLRAFFGDIVQAGARGPEIAQAVHGSTLSRTDFGAVRLGVAAMGGSLAIALFFVPVLCGTPAILWLGHTGLISAAFLAAALGRPEGLSLPGSLLWLGGVRRSYERRVARDEGGLAPMLRALARVTLLLAVVVATVGVPLAAYTWFGFFWVERRYPGFVAPAALAQRFLVDAAFAWTGGFVAGIAWSRFTAWRMRAMLGRLAWEMERLFELRRQWLHERRIS